MDMNNLYRLMADPTFMAMMQEMMPQGPEEPKRFKCPTCNAGE